MRYIRDIIREKEKGVQTSALDSQNSEIKDAKPSPLLLEEPIFPEASDQEPSLPSAALEQLASNRSDQAQTHDTGPKAEIPVTKIPKDATPLRIRERAERLSNIAATADGGSKLGDPFDKLRQPDQERREKAPSVSPLRGPRPDMEDPAADAVSAIQKSFDAEPETDTGDTETLTPLVNALEPDKVHMPAPAAGRGSKVSGRVKTRLLGFSADAFTQDDPFQSAASSNNDFPVGWLVVVSEKGRGRSFALRDGVSSVGRGTDQTICLDIGDNSISRENHISIAYDSERQKFFIGHGGKTNLVRLNNTPLLSTEELNSKDSIRLGETTLRFIAFCDEEFSWTQTTEQAAHRA